ncbi:MAG: serine hydroxymethyltransferase [bacterium]
MNTILQLTQDEVTRQRDTLNLIASENYPSPTTLSLLGTVWSNKYGEGYPGKRYYAGNQNTDQLETFVQQKALQAFDKVGEYGVNVQTLSGSPANQTVFLTILQPGDVVLSPQLPAGGHLTHMHTVSSFAKFFKPHSYAAREVSKNNFEIDFEALKKQIVELKPKLLIVGFSAYPKKYEFADICKFAHEKGTFVLADVAHINGLIAADLHDSPFKKGDEGADFISMTTHKTIRGPRGAVLFAKNYMPEFALKYIETIPKNSKGKPVESLIEAINRTLFPGGYGGPHFNQIAAIGQCFLEVLGEDNYPDNVSFKTYSERVITNCKVLENSLLKNGLEIISPTENHLCLVKLPENSDSLEIQNRLEKIGIITNRNTFQNDIKTAYKPGGMRFGTAALTSRGLTTQTAEALGKIISDLIFAKTDEQAQVDEVKAIVGELEWWY